MERYDRYFDRFEEVYQDDTIKKIQWIERMIKKLENDLLLETDEEKKKIIIERLTEFKKRLKNLNEGREEYYGYNETEINLYDMYPKDGIGPELWEEESSKELYEDSMSADLYSEESSNNKNKK